MSNIPPLSARAAAQQWLTQVLGERLTLDEAIVKSPAKLSDTDQRFAMLLVLSTLQHLGQIDAVIDRYLEKKLPAKRLGVMNAIRLGALQLVLMDTPAHAAVNESVALVKKGKDAGLSGLVNAVLQKIAREKPTLPEAFHNLPPFLRPRWEKRYGADAVAVMAQVAALRAPLDIQSTEEMPNGTRIDAQMVRLTEHAAVEQLPGYAEGKFFVQDLAASYPVRMLGDVKQRQVLDICAAPGGKAMQLVQAGAFVTALDRSSARMRTLKENMTRMQMQVNTIAKDVFAWEPSRSYDAILLDAPCTATGTWRRHPEVVQHVNQAEIDEMATLQRELLTRAWAWLKPGGKLVYCVCSLEPEEGDHQAEQFARQQADAKLVKPDANAMEIPAECITPQGYLRTLPSYKAEIGGMDGFFAVCFEKKSGT